MRGRGRTSQKIKSERWGRWAEYWVALVLILRGYRILHRRYRCPHGEIDLIARRGRAMRFVEVKFRSRYDDIAQVLPSHASRKRLVRTAQYYMARVPDFAIYDQDFSVVVVSKSLRLRWFDQAFYDL